MYFHCAAVYIWPVCHSLRCLSFSFRWSAYLCMLSICVVWLLLVFVGGFLTVLMSIYCSVERESGENFDMDVIVCVLYWWKICLGHDCLCIILGKILPWTWLFVYYIGENFALDMIVCVLYWGKCCLGHDCLCIMHSLNQYMKHDFVLAVNVQEELVIFLLLVWILWSFFPLWNSFNGTVYVSVCSPFCRDLLLV